MNKEEKELRKYVDEYFDKYMCVSFDKFLENWEETNGLLKYFESKQNELQQRIDKAIELLKQWGEEPDADMYLLIKEYKEWKELLDILRGEKNE